jgi:hypothetical protein
MKQATLEFVSLISSFPCVGGCTSHYAPLQDPIQFLGPKQFVYSSSALIMPPRFRWGGAGITELLPDLFIQGLV